MIRLENVTASFGGKRILDDFSVEFPERGVVCLSGPSGCGKTTLLRVAAGLLKPDSGVVSTPAQPLAFMFQEDRLLPWFTAEENVAAALPRRERRRAADFLALAELSESRGEYPGALSGGMRRRVALARALAFGGGGLILDEPFKGMDQGLTERLSPLIRQAAETKLVLLTSHSEWELSLFGNVTELDGPPLRLR